jgi:hypothetical protein
MVGAGNAVLLRNNQSGGFMPPLTTPVPAAWVAAGDWDQDGLMDVVGTNPLLDLALVGWNQGAGNFTYTSTLQTGFETARVGAADLNGDGLPEIVTCNLRARSISVLENRTASAPTSAVSRKTHGTAGTFDINLPLTGNAGIECRSGGVSSDHQIVVSFPFAVTLSGASVSPGPGGAGPPIVSPDGKQVTVNLTSITDAQTITLNLSNVNNGTSTNDVGLRMSVLAGDTSANGVVNATDVSQTKSRSGQAITSANFRSDVVANGTINSSDVAMVKSRSGAGATATSLNAEIASQLHSDALLRPTAR